MDFFKYIKSISPQILFPEKIFEFFIKHLYRYFINFPNKWIYLNNLCKIRLEVSQDKLNFNIVLNKKFLKSFSLYTDNYISGLENNLDTNSNVSESEFKFVYNNTDDLNQIESKDFDSDLDINDFF